MSSPLGDDALLLTALSRREAISEPVLLRRSSCSPRRTTSPSTRSSARPCAISKLANGEQALLPRHRVALLAGTDARRLRRHLSRRGGAVALVAHAAQRDCRIFQHKTAPDIVKKLFGESGSPTSRSASVTRSDPEREYCVQYRESDFNFVSRLLEDDGISYFFEHEREGAHAGARSTRPQRATRRVRTRRPRLRTAPDAQRDRGEHHEWSHASASCAPASTPSPTTTSSRRASPCSPRRDRALGSRQRPLEIYDYPGEYADARATARRSSKLRMEAEEAAARRVDGASHVRGFTPGYRFDLQRPLPRRRTNERLRASPSVCSTGEQDVGRATPAELALREQLHRACRTRSRIRPPLRTPKPIVRACRPRSSSAPPARRSTSTSTGA